MTHIRYSRQIILPEVGPEGQARLAKSRVLVVGAGGLGSPVLLYLAAAGVGTIGIVDDDFVSESNLQRQILYSNQDLGKQKAVVAGERIQELNPEIRVQVFSQKFDLQFGESQVQNFDIIIDGTDNYATKFLINDLCAKFNKPMVYASVLQLEGQVSIFHSSTSPCYRCLIPEPPKVALTSCAQNGVLGAVVGIVGSIQALETIKVILDPQYLTKRVGKLILIDGKNLEFRTLNLKKDPKCSCQQIGKRLD